MFLRNFVRSLSHSNTSGVKATRGKDRRQRERPRSPSTTHEGAAPSLSAVPVTLTHWQTLTSEVAVGARSGSPGTDTVSAHEAEHLRDSHCSVPAITIANNDNNSDHQYHADSLSLIPAVSSSTTTAANLSLESSSATTTNTKSRPLPTSRVDSADLNLVSNFQFRPLHLETLSPNTDHEPTINSTKPQLPFLLSRSQADIQHGLESYELGVAMQRKVWVKRPGASATRVEVNEDDLVDNVRDVILRKYANSLGRHIDSPDITLKITSREQANKNVALERVLGPEESIGRTLDTYYPGGQTIEEALIIEVPQKRTPKPSPRPGNHPMPFYIPEGYPPGDEAREYFPPMPLQSPRLPHVPHPAGPNGTIPHSMSVLATGQVPALPSPGGHLRSRHRPKYVRQHTSSPTIIHSSQASGLDGKPQLNGVAAPTQPLPTPPAVAGVKNPIAPPNRTTSPHPSKQRKKRQAGSTTNTSRDMTNEPTLPSKPASANLLDGRVPPINVLLVEDNVINLKLLEQFMKRLKVRWKSAMNGKEAVNMWRQGGFHLVLMDIQLPVMNGLEATKEIRRLESVNGIGLSVFGEAPNGDKCASNGKVAAEDKLQDRGMFKSPVIIVALTASSLQSDRHEALAVGCNDFLTKPVNFVWMERKVTEWGCMQALIDFDGWRRWKVIAEKRLSEDPEKRKADEKEEKAKTKAALKAMFARPPPTVKKENSTDSTTRRDDGSGGSSNSISNTTSNQAEQPTNRRMHKGSRSQGSSTSTALGTTLEVDENA